MSTTFYEISPKVDLKLSVSRGFTRVPSEIASRIHSLLPKDQENRVQLTLGIGKYGSSHLLVDTYQGYTLRKAYSLARPRNPVCYQDFLSISPIEFNKEELEKKIKDVSKLNRGFFSDRRESTGKSRAEYECNRIVWHVINDSLHQRYGDFEGAAWRRKLRVCSVVVNVWKSDHNKILDIGFSEADPATLEPLKIRNFIVKGNEMFENQPRKKAAFRFGTEEVLPDSVVIEELTKCLSSERYTVLLVVDIEQFQILKSRGVVSHFTTGLSDLLFRSNPSTVLVLDIKSMVEIMTRRMHASGLITIAELGNDLKLPGMQPLERCGGNEAIQLLEAYKLMTSGRSIDEECKYLNSLPIPSAHPKPELLTSSSQNDAGSDSEEDPNVVATATATGRADDSDDYSDPEYD